MMMTTEPELKAGHEVEDKKFHQNGTEEMTLNGTGIHRRLTPYVGSTVKSLATTGENKLSMMEEEEEPEEKEAEDTVWDNELSAEAQIHKMNMFFCSSTSDSGEELVTETEVITSVYKDPLEVCMEGIEEMARRILRSGKLVINGEPGDMSKVQPAMFNLQASEKDMPQLIPQLLQMPFFHPGKQEQPNLMDYDEDNDLPFFTETNMDEALANGNIRLAIPVDTAIYSLLRSHCAKGARQAEEVINTAIRGSYIPSHNPMSSYSTMPPIVKFNSNPRPSLSRHTIADSGIAELSESSHSRRERLRQPSNLSVSPEEGRSSGSSSKLSTYSSISTGTNYTSYSSLPRSDNSDTNLAARRSSDEADIVAPSLSEVGSRRVEPIIEEETEDVSSPRTLTPKLMKSFSNKVRKTSTVIVPPMMSRNRVDSVGSDTSNDSLFVPSGHLWNTSIFDNNTVVAQYGGTPHPMIYWDQAFKLDFRLSTSVGLLSGAVTGIDPSKPEVTLKVFNNSPKQIGFSIRSNRLSTIFSSHVVYPNRGLEILEPYKSWEDTVEFMPNNPSTTEMFVVDLFFCTVDAEPVWNISRKYAIMKAHKSPNQLRRASKRRFSHLQLPGTRELKGDNLEVVLSHGLQCVVKDKLDEAEIIFSQALSLPDFQRVPLKAFVYICLGVLANKRNKLAVVSNLKPIIKAVESSNKLVSICEQGPGSVKMPYTIQLVKQLKKELNLEKIIKEQHMRFVSGSKRSSSKLMEEKLVEEFKDITPEGGELVHKGIKVTIPPGALPQGTSISLSKADSKHLIPMLKASGWEKIVQVVSAIHMECNPPVDHFKKPIEITASLPEDTKLDSNSLIRLVHSNFLRHWVDITDDVSSKISISGNKVFIETNRLGWLAVSMIQFNASMIAQMVLKSISIDPILLRLSVFGFVDTEQRSIQVAIFAVPCKGNEEPIHRDLEKPENFVAMSFPHVVQAYPNEKLRISFQGNFEADLSVGEEDLAFEMDVQQKHNQIHTKWVKSSSDVPLSGKLRISSCRNNYNTWEVIADISLSMRSCVVSSNALSSSDH